VKQIKLLYEDPEGPAWPAFDLPPRLEELYGGPFGLASPRVYANFVSSIDGVVALDRPHSSAIIGGGTEADRLVMALLRASADAVLIGASTLKADPGHRWTPEFVYPDAAAEFAELRTRLHLAARPQLVVMTGRGDLDPSEPAMADALILTTESGAERLRAHPGLSASVVAMGADSQVSVGDVVRALRARGHRSILCEGGPSLIGQLLRRQLLDELFLTLSPVLAGRMWGERRPGLVDGIHLLPDAGVWGRLRSVRAHESHLFLRYDLRAQEQA
jgi:riboflavin biosynthesis pyrimidine reductase